MIPSRRWLMLPFLATCALLLSGPVQSQEPDEKKPVKKAVKDDDTKPSKADTEAATKLAALEKALIASQKDLEATKKDVEAAKKSAVEATTALQAITKSVTGVATSAKEAKDATAAITKALEDAKATAPDPKKAEEEAKKVSEEIGKAASAGSEGQARADTSWILVSSAFVLFMVPGLALFYGGMVRRKNVLATMMQSMAALAVVGVYWVAIGYALAFGPSVQKLSALGVEDGGLFGWSWDLVFLKGIAFDSKLPGYNIPVYLHVMFQGMFAIITPALISGAIAERIRFWPFCIFMILWVTFVYCPLAHMVWAFDWFDPTVLAAKRGASAIGFLGKMGALDFAGGTVVHIAAGMAGLACCLVLRRRDGYPKMVTHPNSMVLTLLGAGFLWFGWFGFNGGSALNGTAQAVSAFTATQAAAAAAGLAWMVIEWLHKGKPTALGLASGIVAGLVAVTPASGYVYLYGGVAIGVAAALICYIAVFVKGILGYDDSLDAFGVHGVGGFVGAVLTGLFCTSAIYPAGGDGFFAYKYHRARAVELETKLITEAKTASGEATKKVEAAEADLKKIPVDKKDDIAAAEKAVTEAKDVATDATATFDGYEAELKKLKELFDKQDDKANDGKDKKTPTTQLMIQIQAAGVSAVFAFALSLVLALLTQAMTLGNFSTSKKDEAEGLDRTEHGEIGFDFGFATETVSVVTTEPKAALVPKGNGRFELGVEGTDAGDLRKVWTAMCQPSDKSPDPDFLAVYPHVTTFSGNRFRLRGGDPAKLAARLESLLRKQFPGKAVKVTRV